MLDKRPIYSVNKFSCSQLRDDWQAGAGFAGAICIMSLVVIGMLGPYLVPYGPGEISGPSLDPPSLEHLLGTNALGQDVLSQLIYGCRNTLVVGFSVGMGAGSLGFIIGAAAVYSPGWIGRAIMATIEFFAVIPRLPVVVIMATFLRPALSGILVILILCCWPVAAHDVLRSGNYQLKTGHPSGRGGVSLRSVLSGSFPALVARFLTTASYAIMSEAALSFLGLSDPASRSWGAIIRSALDYPGILWTEAWSWWLVPPALLISVTVIGLTLMGCALEEDLAEYVESLR